MILHVRKLLPILALMLVLLCVGCSRTEQTITPSPVPQATQAAPEEEDVVLVPGEASQAPVQAPEVSETPVETEVPKPTEPSIDIPIVDDPTAAPTAAATAKPSAKATPKPSGKATSKPTATPKPTATARPTATPAVPSATPTPNNDIELPEIP